MDKLIYLKQFETDDLGSLAFFEGDRDVNFPIKRIYYIYGVAKDKSRGGHAHKSLKQILWCPYGVIEVRINDGRLEKTYRLDSPEKALILSGGVWRTMHWIEESSVLCAAASDYYTEDDYIRNFEDYLEYVKKGYWANESKI